MSDRTVFDCNVLQLPRIRSGSGNITVVQGGADFPFEIKRVFYIYDIPGGESRGAHTHRNCHQFLVAASGSFEVRIDDGKLKRNIRLNRPFFGVHIPPMIWASEINFSSGAVCLVLASSAFDESDYIRDYSEFLELKNAGRLKSRVQ